MDKIRKTLGAASIVGTLSLLPALSVQADGLYIGAGLYQAGTDYEDFKDDDTVPAAFLGYNFIDTNLLMVSVELGYYDLGDLKDQNIKISADAFTLAGVAYLPIGPFFEVYAKAGMASATIDVDTPAGNYDEDDQHAFGGLGFAFDILDTIDIYAEYLQFDNEIDSDLIGVGVRLDF
jgi:opacity protein-like surface antigen